MTRMGDKMTPANLPETDPLERRTPQFDERTWLLANQLQGLHRSREALRRLIQRDGSRQARVVEVWPRLGDETYRERVVAPPSPFPANGDWDRPAPALEALVPPPGHATRTLEYSGLDAIGVSVIGLRGRDLAHAIEMIVDGQISGSGFKPVILTDSSDFSPMTRAGLVCEYVSDAAWDGAVVGDLGLPEAMVAFVTRKWGIASFLDLRTVRAPALPAPAPVTAPVAAPAAQSAAPAPVRAAPPPVARAVPRNVSATGRRPRAAVVAWDMAHNPAGRAMVLYDLLERDYDVELVGPLWSRFGQQPWAPIRESGRRTRTFRCDRFTDFWPKAMTFAADSEYDLVVVSKPRMPALLLGALIKQTCGCPMVLDIDDFELSFFPDETPASLDELAAAGAEAFHEPYLELCTRACDAITGEADARIVSNIALRQRFGGTIVRHARDEGAFHPDRFDIPAERAAMGIAPEDFALLFVGTIRAHKGVFDIARTLHGMEDKRFVLHLVGDIPDARVRAQLDQYSGARMVVHPGCPFDELPAKIAAADAVVLLQDVDHPISKFQIPAKVSDASALGVPVLASDVPPLRDLALQGAVRTITPDELGAVLTELADARGTPAATISRRNTRAAFEAELGNEINRTRLDFAIEEARRAPASLSPGLSRLLQMASTAYTELRRPQIRAQAAPEILTGAPARFDVVSFWKQNDSGIYGRRSDMIMRHMLASGRIGRILQFDAPFQIPEFAAGVDVPPGAVAARIMQNAIDNQFALRDTPRHMYRTLMWDRRQRPSALPHVAAGLESYPDYVAEQMERVGMRPETSIAWVFPVAFDAPRILEALPFAGVVGDLIDDQRQFQMREVYRERIVASYAQTLPLFDLTFTNCPPMAEAFAELAPGTIVVPNGTERFPADPGPRPPELAALTRPIAGYVGNLRDRFDWDLLRDTARAMPDIDFVIVGGGAREEDVAKLDGLDNVTFTGLKPKDEVPAYLAAFDVALVPHTIDALTGSMNPLKIFDYFAARRRIVSTEVGNVDPAIRPWIAFAPDAEGFVREIRRALASPPTDPERHDEIMAQVSWGRRVSDILDHVDTWLEEKRAAS